MKRLLIVLLAVATVPLLAVPAAAKKGGIPGPPDPEPRVSVTCVSPWWEGDIHDSDGDGDTDDFTIYLDRENQDACVDVLIQTPGKWLVTVTQVEGLWRRPELMMVPRDAAWADWPSDSCGGEKRYGAHVFDNPWVLPPPDDPRGFTVVPAATVNACPGNAALEDPPGDGGWPERVERAGNVESFLDFDEVANSAGPVDLSEDIGDATDEVHPLAFVVWSHNLRKGDRIEIHVDLPELGD